MKVQMRSSLAEVYECGYFKLTICNKVQEQQLSWSLAEQNKSDHSKLPRVGERKINHSKLWLVK